jgi:hypothetical protein
VAQGTGHAALARGAREVADGMDQRAVQVGRTLFDGGGVVAAQRLGQAGQAVFQRRERRLELGHALQGLHFFGRGDHRAGSVVLSGRCG